MKPRKWLVTPFLAVLAACGSDGITAPEVCQQFPGVTVFVGEVESITPCFTSEGSITYSVVSSDPDVAEATVQGSRVEIQGLMPGDTDITITASNTEGSSDLVIPVTVPNRDPEVITAPNSVRLGVGWSFEYDLATVFRDPDGQSLTYTAEANPTGVVDIAIDADVLAIEGVGPGTAAVLVTATDGASQAVVTIPVTVIATVTLYENDFSRDYDRWVAWRNRGNETGSELRVHEGVFEVWGTDDTYRGTAIREVSAESFDVRSRVRPGPDSVDVRIGALLDHDIHFQVEIALTPYGDDDFYVIAYNDNTGAFERWTYGNIEGGVRSDEWIDFRWWWANGRYHISLNGEQFSFGESGTTTPQMDLLAFVSDHHWSDNLGGKGFMDQIEVRGFPPNSRIGPASRREWQVRR